MYQVFLFLLLNFQNSGWELLEKVELEREWDDFMAMDVDRAVFSEELKSMAGKTIFLSGYIIPLEQSVDQKYFVLSRFPFQSCFFCGAAGPETVVEVYPTEKIRVSDKLIRMSGTLELNDSDPLHLFYALRKAEIVEID